MYLYSVFEYLERVNSDFPHDSKTILSRAVSAEVRAAMAARRLTIRDLAKGAKFGSHNYLAIRLRDEKPFTLDDVNEVCLFLDEDPIEFIAQAYENHGDRLFAELVDERDRYDKRLRETTERVAERMLPESLRQPARGREEMQQLDDIAARDEDREA